MLNIVIRETDALIIHVSLPGHEFDLQVYVLLVADALNAKHLFHIDEPHSADLHEIAEFASRLAQQAIVDVSDVDHVIADQAMPSVDKVQRTFTLADAALTGK